MGVREKDPVIVEQEKLYKRYGADVIQMAHKIFRQRLKDSNGLDPDEAMRTERAKALDDFDYFLKRYFGQYFKYEDGPAQQELNAVVNKFRDKASRKPVKASRAMPRGYGKSTRNSLGAPLWLMLRKDWHFIVMISSTRDSAKRLLNAIIQEVEDNELLLRDFPELEPARDQKGQLVSWTDNDIAFRGGGRIIAKGFLNALRGARYKQYRPSALVIDDPDEEKDISSESRMRRKYQWLDRAALRLGDQWGIDVLMSYTTIAPNCVGEFVYTNPKYAEWDRKKWKAIEIDENGQEYSTWPQGAPLEGLRALRDGDGTPENPGDPIMFAQELQNEPLAEVDQRFKGLIQTYDFEGRADWTGWRLALAADLSLGKTEKSDFSAIVGVGMAPDGVCYEIYSDIQRRRPDQIERDFLAALQLFPWTVAGAEINGNQEYFLLNFRKIVAEFNKAAGPQGKKILTPLKDIMNSGDKEARITSTLQPAVAAGLLRLRSDSSLLFSQLSEFPYGKKDGPDALSMAYVLLKEYNQVVTVKAEVRQPPGQLGNRISQDRINNVMKKYRIK